MTKIINGICVDMKTLRDKDGNYYFWLEKDYAAEMKAGWLLILTIFLCLGALYVLVQIAELERLIAE